jgi:glutathione S-transferase
MTDFVLHHTPTSPYARMVRVLILEKGLEDRVEILAAKTRVAGSPYYAINPSGRVPYLVRKSDGTGFEDSSLILDVLDGFGGPRRFGFSDGEVGLAERRLEAQARSLIDGLAVWAREQRRPEDERSPGIIAHEQERARRMASYFEEVVAGPCFSGDFNRVQLTLVTALGMEGRFGFEWREGRPGLAAFADPLLDSPSLAATRP